MTQVIEMVKENRDHEDQLEPCMLFLGVWRGDITSRVAEQMGGGGKRSEEGRVWKIIIIIIFGLILCGICNCQR